MIIITGAAGFIGSGLLWALNQRGRTDVIIVDDIDHEEKEHNIAPLHYEQRWGIDEFRQKLKNSQLDDAGIEAVLHLGAISATTETDWHRLLKYNVEYTQDSIRWCADRDIHCIYASSGATYGDGSHGYSDDHELFDQLEPLNLYGKSKLLVDVWARDGGYLDQVVGLRYFNVYGPNEYHKGFMSSVITKKYEELKREGIVRLYKSYRPDIADGEQKRDFLYIKDAVEATLFFLDHPPSNGVYNIGTGTARTWNDVARAMFAAVNKPEHIEYEEMPDNVRKHYQYYTQADISKLRAAGYTKDFTSIETAIKDYLPTYLAPHKHLGEE